MLSLKNPLSWLVANTDRHYSLAAAEAAPEIVMTICATALATRRIRFRSAGICVVWAWFVALAAADTGPAITTPKQFFGFNIGDDYSLANYQQLSGYWSKLERESKRLKVVRIGVSAEGRSPSHKVPRGDRAEVLAAMLARNVIGRC